MSVRENARFIVICLLVVALFVTGFVWFCARSQKPYQWSRDGRTYANDFYGLRITGIPQWIRYHPKKFFYLPKDPLIVFLRHAAEGEGPQGIVEIGVENIKGNPHASSLQRYAKYQLEKVTALKEFGPKIWLKDGAVTIEKRELNGEPCGWGSFSINEPTKGDMQGEFYVLKRGDYGFVISYTAPPKYFERFHREALQMIQSVYVEAVSGKD